ncbi:hypothetical protein PHLCEN_2v8728 [Hermanssonia centrifuga]|uniref:Uncharacterized protein n=1 Tax=Hermanssonia centrifuga TaxID=98765 RepID=A0A2R6NSW7_9APHY|nr:hypothetical protein PHLCEN_2v8728 [Hermanssonia centrifuga]
MLPSFPHKDPSLNVPRAFVPSRIGRTKLFHASSSVPLFSDPRDMHPSPRPQVAATRWSQHAPIGRFT